MNKWGLGLLLLLWGGLPAWAADFPQAARETQADLRTAGQELTLTKQRIAENERALRDRLADLQAQMAAERKLQASRQEELTRVSRQKAAAAQELREVSGDLQELAGHVRTAARELLTLAETSPGTAENPGRLAALRAMLQKGFLPGLDQIEELTALYCQEIAAASQIKRRQGHLVDRSGNLVTGEIIRLGVFTTLYRRGDETGFLLPGPDPTRLLAVQGDLPWGVAASLAEFVAGQSRAAPLDLSAGAALRGLARQPSWEERLASGGPLVWPILATGLLALLLVLERVHFLHKVRSNTEALLGRVTEFLGRGDLDQARQAAAAEQGRPVANVTLAGLELIGQSPEAVDTRLQEAMLREMPRLERSLTVLKVLAAVAPLLGLLGTVTGMINTFQVITLHGSGEPRLMAGGISEALVTTQLGLAVAIPIMVAVALLGRQSQRVAGDMEEKSLRLSAALWSPGERP
ncbi:MAG: MotA/TolQ/ExbB proton channel family protein [Deltaproteobacteria bacterium]|nr:MotA/TolQ/ExbB proton channel family protein [Deltaproteobacteria bacterium]